MHKLLLFFFISLFPISIIYGQEQLKIENYIRINDIGIKIIDKKKLKKDIDKLQLDKKQLKTLKSRLKTEEKEAKSGIKSYNVEVYKKRREEEFSIRSGSQSSTKTDTILDVTNEELFAKKVDKVFDEEVIEEELIETEDSVQIHPIVPEKRQQYSWVTDLEQKPCDWDVYYIDYVERDTIYKSNTHTVFYNNKKEKDVPQAEVTMTILKENKQYFFEINYNFFNLEIQKELNLTKTNTIRFTLKDKQTVIIPFTGYKQKASISSDYKKQKLSGRYRLSPHMINSLTNSKWKSLSIEIGSEQFQLIFSKNFTGKAEKSEISSLFKPQLLCIQNQ